jgi:hypothetical protein
LIDQSKAEANTIRREGWVTEESAALGGSLGDQAAR